MRRLFAGLMMAALAGLTACADDKPAVKEGDTEVSFKELRKQFEQVQKQLGQLAQDYRNAKSDEEKKDIEKKFNTLQDKLGGSLLSFAESHPKDGDSFDALVLALRSSRGPEKSKDVWGRAMSLLQKDWAKKPQIKPMLRMFSGMDDDASERLLRTILEENPDHKLQGVACKALRDRADTTLQTVQRLKDNKELRGRIEKDHGKDVVKQLLAKEDKARENKKKYDKLLTDKFPEILDLSVGKKIPDVVCEDLEGNKVKLSDLRGKVVMLDLWATWCGYCVQMIPHERKMVERLKGKPFVLVSVSVDEEKKTVTEFLKGTKMPWTHWWSGTSGFVSKWEVEGYPTIFILDTKGVIRHKFTGAPPEEQLDKAIDEVLEETDKKAKE